MTLSVRPADGENVDTWAEPLNGWLDQLQSAVPSDYSVFMSGATAIAQPLNPSNPTFSGTDPAAVLQSAITQLGAAAGTITLVGALTWGSVPTLPKSITGKLHIKGIGTTVVTLSAAGLRFADFTRVADYDTFQNVELSDFTVDRANLTSSTTHVLLGNLQAASWSRRVNFDKITVRRVNVINVPTGTVANYQVFSLGSSHLASAETQTSITNILLEDCDFQGGNVGVAMLGTGAYTAGSGVNVWHDKIKMIRVKHDTLAVPAVGRADANFQIGGVGYGGTVRMSDCYGANSGDVGYEIDSIQDFVADGCVGVDSWNAKFFSRNFRPPLSLNAQKNTWRDCYGRNINVDRVNRDCSDFEVGGDAATAGYVFGEMAILDGHCADEITTIPAVGGANLAANGIQFRKLTIRNLSISYANLAPSGGGNSPVLLDLRSLYLGAVYDLDGLHWQLAGARTGAGNNQWKMMRICGLDADLRLRRATVDMADFTGLSTGSDTFYWVGMAIDFSSTVKAHIDGFSFVTTPGGTHQVVELSTGYTVGGNRIVIEGLDTVKGPAGFGFDVHFANAAQKAATHIRRIVSQRSAASTSGPITAPTALTGLVTATGATVGSVSAGVPCIVQFVQGTGANVTAIDFSTNGGVTYTNLLTQAAATLPAGPCISVGPLHPDALIKVTFATTQPTINLIPVP